LGGDILLKKMVRLKEVTTRVLAHKIDDVHEDILEVKALIKEQNGRIRKNEFFRAWFTGGLSLLAFLVGLGLVKLFF
jgi:hypothetical protein